MAVKSHASLFGRWPGALAFLLGFHFAKSLCANFIFLSNLSRFERCTQFQDPNFLCSRSSYVRTDSSTSSISSNMMYIKVLMLLKDPDEDEEPPIGFSFYS